MVLGWPGSLEELLIEFSKSVIFGFDSVKIAYQFDIWGEIIAIHMYCKCYYYYSFSITHCRKFFLIVSLLPINSTPHSSPLSVTLVLLFLVSHMNQFSSVSDPIMANSSVTFKSVEDLGKHNELEEACKAGFAPAEVDEEKNSNQNVENVVCDEDNKDSLEVDEAMVDESRQMDFAKVDKRVETTGCGSTGTVPNLHFGEDTTKYLLNPDVNSAQYAPMHENPLPDSDRNEKFYGVGNQYRTSGQALEFKQLNIPVWEAYELKGQDIRNRKRRAEFWLQNDKVIEESLNSKTKDLIMEKYGNAIPEELLGELLLGQETALLPRKKYQENVYINNHTTVWGSWWKDNQWGYNCCKQTIRDSYCTGAAGIEAVEETASHES